MTADVDFSDLQKGFTGLYGENKIVMQSTGLVDRQGKEIFEGDLMLMNYGGLEEVVEVYWGNDCGQWLYCPIGKDKGKVLFPLGVRNYKDGKAEIIGNIYEHSHLLPSV